MPPLLLAFALAMPGDGASREYAGTLALAPEARPLHVHDARFADMAVAGGAAGARAGRHLPPVPWAMAFLPDGRLAAELYAPAYQAGPSWEVGVWDADAREEVWRAPVPDHPPEFQWHGTGSRPLALSPDGARLAIVRPSAEPWGAELASWDARTGAPHAAAALGGGHHAHWEVPAAWPQFSRDGRHLLVAGRPGAFAVHLRSGDVRKLLRGAAVAPAGEPDAALLLERTSRGGLDLVRADFPPPQEVKRAGGVATGATFGQHDAPAESVAVSPDGAVVALWRSGGGAERSAAHFFDARTLERLGRAEAPGDESPDFFRFLAGGRAAIVGRTTVDVRIIEVPSGRRLATIPLGEGRAVSLAATPDGRTLAVRWTAQMLVGQGELVGPPHPRVALVDVLAGKVTRQLTGPREEWSGSGGPVAVRADGKRVALGVLGGVQLFDLP